MNDTRIPKEGETQAQQQPQQQKQQQQEQEQQQQQGQQQEQTRVQEGTDAGALQRELQELRQRLEERERQLQELTERLRHLQADFDNYKKRVEREREEFTRVVEDQFLLKILPIYDNLERAFRSYNHNNDKDSFIEGMERIFAQFSEFLKNEGVRPIEALGKPFDPLLHEALLSVETDQDPPNVVLEEFERGYLRAERVLRPSRVKVSRRPAQAQPQPTADPTPARGTDESESGDGGSSDGGNPKEKEEG